jgi:hypothetical protein
MSWIVLQGGGPYELVYDLCLHLLGCAAIFLGITIIVISSWSVSVRMRGRIKKDLGGAAYEGDLTSIATWMKVDKVEENAAAGLSRDWVPKSSGSGSQIAQPYSVVRSFVVSEPISGKRYRFLQGMVVIADLSQDTPNVTIDLGRSYFVVDFLTFDNCCKREQGL